jgi:hypothetical protein
MKSLTSFILLLTLVPTLVAAPLTVSNLCCDGSTNPLGIDTAQPRLSWQLRSDENAKAQTAWQVCVSSSAALMALDKGDLWDSGRVASDDTAHVPYRGAALASSQQVFWKVRVWDEAGAVSAWSEPASWTMGLLSPEHWRAQWIAGQCSEPAANARPIGYHATEARRSNDTKWVQVDLGKSVPISAVTLLPMRHANRDGFAFPVRFKVEAANEATFTRPTLVADHTGRDFPNPGVKPVSYKATNLSARYVRVTATTLWKRDTMYCFALRQLQVTSGENNAALGAAVSHFDSVET